MKQQHGSALIISLLILLVMTIIGISAMSSSTMEEKMAANDRNQKAIFQNAESALVTASTALIPIQYENMRTDLQRVDPDPDKLKKGYLNQDDPSFKPLDSSSWVTSGTNANCIAINNNSNNNGDSCYVVEAVQQSPNSFEARDYDNPTTRVGDIMNYKITVRSTDANRVSTATLQGGLKVPIPPQ